MRRISVARAREGTIEQIAYGGFDITRTCHELIWIERIIRKQPPMERAYFECDDIRIEVMNVMIVEVKLADEETLDWSRIHQELPGLFSLAAGLARQDMLRK
jgi:hypothetical protein